MSENVVEKGKELIAKFYIGKNEAGIPNYHSVDVYGNEECNNIFICSNLSDCPENAVIGGNLFDGYDYISAVEFGMRLAKLGYDSIDYELVDDDKETI